ncbi:hypothetical protein SAMN05421644_15110 [Allochromatium warmingii]|uniref:CRISPR system Cascade subunit CasD n=1 Tax=Allochromatium warmingii TaxID=61595 RepID=A0A1H3J2P9_ALLWA|nr:hypothetical protein [Allochromatium warmingii]SDY33698.1 hypothetical protein SAMN05421644_15110 [Allochromatium warmingii]
MSTIVGLRATTLTPFAYHSLAVKGGTATLPELISDNALCFGLAAVLGHVRAWSALPAKDYQRDLRAMPWRSSVLMADEPRLLPPLARRLNLEEEGGFPKKLRDVANKGNLKQFWTTQEVPPASVFRGALFGIDPFAETGLDAFVIRVGLHRNGMVKLERDDQIRTVRLNAWTAMLFERTLSVQRFLIYPLQLTASMPLDEAAQEVAQWN